MYTKKQYINTLCTLEYKNIYSKYTRIQDYIPYVHQKTRLYTLRTLENKIYIYSTYTRKQDCILYVFLKTRFYTLCILENKTAYSMHTRKQDYILYVY